MAKEMMEMMEIEMEMMEMVGMMEMMPREMMGMAEYNWRGSELTRATS